MVKVKPSVSLLAIAIAVLSIAMLSQVTAQDNSDVSADPYILIFGTNSRFPLDYGYYSDTSSILYSDDGNATIRLKIGMPREESMLVSGQSITSVSYNASWQNNKPIVLFSGKSGEDLFFNIDGIPYGNQSIQVTASGTVHYCDNDFTNSRIIEGNSTKYLDFTVAPTHTPTPEPTLTSSPTDFGHNLEQTVIVTALVVAFAVIALAFYKRRQHITSV